MCYSQSYAVLRAHSPSLRVHVEFTSIIVQGLILFAAADCSDRLHLVSHTLAYVQSNECA